jgi:hypothetical protein
MVRVKYDVEDTVAGEGSLLTTGFAKWDGGLLSWRVGIGGGVVL